MMDNANADLIAFGICYAGCAAIVVPCFTLAFLVLLRLLRLMRLRDSKLAIMLFHVVNLRVQLPDQFNAVM